MELVINYDIPLEEEYYVHRIGRTGRNGKTGKAYTFVVGREKYKLFNIERYAKTKIIPGNIPTDKEMQSIKSQKILGKIQNIVDNEKYMENPMIDDIYQKLGCNNENEKLTKALLQMAIGDETIIYRLNTSLPKENDNRINAFDNNRNKKKERALKRKEVKNGISVDSAKNMEELKRNKKNNVEKGYKRFFVSLGKLDKVKVNDIVGGITANTEIAGGQIGKIDIMDKFSFVEIPDKFEKTFLDSMNGKSIKGKKVRIEVANKK